MEIVLSIICIVLLVVVIYLLYTTQMKLHEKMAETQANSSSLDRQYNSIITMLNDASRSLGQSDTKINQMINDMHDINVIMTNTKKRGTFGEYQLYHILSLYCGDNSHIFESQYHLSNGKIGDAALHLPGNTKVLIIDSKFPMENYLNLQEDMDTYLRPFKMNMKKHIDDVANKYINIDTMPYALLFVPSEAIYQFVCAKCDDLFTYALQKHVMLVSPTTLVAEVMTLLSSTKDFYRTSHMEEIERNILLLQEDASRLVERSIKAEKTLETLATQFHAVSISAQKLSSRMTKMGEDE